MDVSLEQKSAGDFRVPAAGSDFENFLATLIWYWAIVKRRWVLLCLVPVLAGVSAYLISKFYVTHWYVADAIIRPEGESSAMSKLSGMQLGTSPNLLSGLLGGGGGGGSDAAQEYITVLSSFHFCLGLIERHDLQEFLLKAPHGRWRPVDFPQWRAFQTLSKRLTTNYVPRTGNLTLTYTDPDRATAERILGYFIDDLRNKLRQQTIRNTSDAIASLQETIRGTSDPMLLQQFYELLARQIEEQKLAQVQADFSFSVIELPIAPDRPSKPSNTIVAAVSTMIVFMLCAGWVAVVEIRQRYGHLLPGSKFGLPEAETYGEETRDLQEAKVMALGRARERREQ